jgi:hypothetical protein
LTVSLLPKNHMLFIVSKQCACSRRVPIEGHMNRFEYCHPDNNSDNDNFGSFLSKNHIFCNINRHFMKVSTEIDNNFGYEKITQLVDNIPLMQTTPRGRYIKIALNILQFYSISCDLVSVRS